MSMFYLFSYFCCKSIQVQWVDGVGLGEIFDKIKNIDYRHDHGILHCWSYIQQCIPCFDKSKAGTKTLVKKQGKASCFVNVSKSNFDTCKLRSPIWGFFAQKLHQQNLSLFTKFLENRPFGSFLRSFQNTSKLTIGIHRKFSFCAFEAYLRNTAIGIFLKL